jgi:primosomal protein N' (replication factor Y)
MSQQQLFELDPTPWELDAAQTQLVATVVFPTGPEKTFDYSVPDKLRDQVEAGRRIRAPFGRGDRIVEGYCIRLETKTNVSRRLKALSSVVDERTLLSPTMLP